MKRVYFQGAFDMFHWMHLESFRLARGFGDHLIVGINSDELIESYKDKKAVFPFKYRAEIVSALRYVDEVVKVDDRKSLVMLEQLRPDVYVICDEWAAEKDDERAFMASIGGEVVVLPYIEAEFMKGIKEKMRANMDDKLKNLCEKCHQEL